MATRKIEVWCAMIPEIFGYGLMVFEHSEAEARKALKKYFYEMRKSYHSDTTFAKAMDYFGGSVMQVEIGKRYFDNIGE